MPRPRPQPRPFRLSAGRSSGFGGCVWDHLGTWRTGGPAWWSNNTGGAWVPEDSEEQGCHTSPTCRARDLGEN